MSLVSLFKKKGNYKKFPDKNLLNANILYISFIETYWFQMVMFDFYN